LPALILGAVVVVGGAWAEDRTDALFRPLTGEIGALSPDGGRVAVTTQAGGDLRIVIMTLDPPGPTRTVRVDGARDPITAEELPPRNLRFLHWASSTRLVYAPDERVMPLPALVDKAGHSTPNPDGPAVFSPVFVVDVDGKERGTLVDARDFQETPADARRTLADLLRTPLQLAAASNGTVHWRMPHIDILGFLPPKRDQLIILTHGAYSKPGQHLVDLKTGDVSDFGTPWPVPPAEPQVFDWNRMKVVGEREPTPHSSTNWRDEELARIQREVESNFPRRLVEILDWTETRTRVLVRVSGGSDPGRVFVLRRPDGVFQEIAPCAPWLPADKLNENHFFECAAADGGHLSGYVTWPAKPASFPPALLVKLPSGFPGHPQPAYDPESQMFADLGFAVARLNHRSVDGIAASDVVGLRTGLDRLSINDAKTVVQWLAGKNPDHPFDRQRVVAFGRGFGGYLAVRAVELEPGVFRAAVALDAPMDFRSWSHTPAASDVPAALVDHPGTDWKKLSVIEQADALRSPVLLLNTAGGNAPIDAGATELQARMGGPGHLIETGQLDLGFSTGQAAARASVYRKMADFINRTVPPKSTPTASTGTAP
jgi:dienelactone hydrolase